MIEHIVIPFLSSFLGFCGALMIYLLKNNHEREVEERKHEQQMHDKMKYFSALLPVIIQTTKKQIEEMEKYIQRLSDEPLEFHYFNIVVNESLKRVSERMDQSDLFHASSLLQPDGKKRADILDCLTSIDFLHQVTFQILDFHQRNMENVVLLEKTYRDTSEKTLDKVGLELENPRNPGGLQETGFNIFLKELFENYHKKLDGEETIALRQEQFIEPFISKYSSFIHEPLMKEIIVDLKNCSHIYNEINKSIDFMADTLEEYKLRQEGSVKKIEDYFKKL